MGGHAATLHNPLWQSNRLCRTVHYADELAKLLRELSLLLSRPESRRVLVRLAASSRTRADVERLEHHPKLEMQIPVTPELLAALDHVKQSVDASVSARPALRRDATALPSALDAASVRRGPDWFAFEHGMQLLELDRAPWGAAPIRSSLIAEDVSGEAKLIGIPTAESWTQA